MDSVNNKKTEDRTKILEMVLSSPGMKETCKIVLKPTRQTILVLSHLIEKGMEKTGEGKDGGVFDFIPEDSISELKSILEELLKKGGLNDFYGRLKQL